MSSRCPVCQSEVQEPSADFNHDCCDYSCPRCGPFRIDDLFADNLPRMLQDDIQSRAKISHWIRTRHESLRDKRKKETILLTRELVDDIIRNPAPSIAEQKNKLVLWLGDNSHPGESLPVNADIHLSVIGAITARGFLLVLNELTDTGLVTPVTVGGQPVRALTCRGWEYYEELRRGTVNSRTAFMAMKYNETQLDDIVQNVFRAAVRQTGFDLTVLRDKPKAGLIDDRLRVEIRAARFLIADLTHENAGAYWEAGYAEGLGRPVIYTCERKKFEDSKTHFDPNHHLTVLWDSEKQKDTAKELKATIRATLPAEAKLTDD